MGPLPRLLLRARRLLTASPSTAGLRGSADGKVSPPLSERLVERTKALWRGCAPAPPTPTPMAAAELPPQLEAQRPPPNHRRGSRSASTRPTPSGFMERAKVLWRGPARPSSASRDPRTGGADVSRPTKTRRRHSTADSVKLLLQKVNNIDRRVYDLENEGALKMFVEAAVTALVCSTDKLKEMWVQFAAYLKNLAEHSTGEDLPESVASVIGPF